jgi:ankyrin repeat protein
LSQGFDANAKNIHGETALHRVKDVTIAKCLIEHGADVHVKDNACQTPLFVAHHVGMIDYLIECGAEINGGRCPLYFVRSLAVLKCMLRHGADVVALRSDISTWLRYIGLSLSSLLDNGVDVNVRDKDNQSTLLHYVSDADDARVLLERGASVHARDKMGRTPLHTQQSYEVQKLLLEAKADVNARDDKGATPLHSTPNAELLLQHGADIHARDKHGRSALHVRVRSPYDAYPECPASRVDTLIGHGADVHARDAEGKTPLHDANESVVSCLLSHGADINSQDDKGCTRLHTLLRSSTYSWNRHVISDMLKHKADIHIVNNDGMTPLDIARSRNDQEIVERMLSMQK